MRVSAHRPANWRRIRSAAASIPAPTIANRAGGRSRPRRGRRAGPRSAASSPVRPGPRRWYSSAPKDAHRFSPLGARAAPPTPRRWNSPVPFQATHTRVPNGARCDLRRDQHRPAPLSNSTACRASEEETSSAASGCGARGKIPAEPRPAAPPGRPRGRSRLAKLAVVTGSVPGLASETAHVVRGDETVEHRADRLDCVRCSPARLPSSSLRSSPPRGPRPRASV